MIRIRMQRGGRTHRPVYTIVATDCRNPRDGRFLQKLGQYDPAKSEGPLNSVDVDGIKDWVGKGALLSDTVRTLLKKQKISLA
jgi:small subunit ribosomal protein S16